MELTDLEEREKNGSEEMEKMPSIVRDPMLEKDGRDFLGH